MVLLMWDNKCLKQQQNIKVKLLNFVLYIRSTHKSDYVMNSVNKKQNVLKNDLQVDPDTTIANESATDKVSSEMTKADTIYSHSANILSVTNNGKTLQQIYLIHPYNVAAVSLILKANSNCTVAAIKRNWPYCSEKIWLCNKGQPTVEWL